MPNPRALIITPDQLECQNLITTTETLGFDSQTHDSVKDIRDQVHLFKPDVLLINCQLIQSNLLDFVLRLTGKQTIHLGLISKEPQTRKLLATADPDYIHLLQSPLNFQELSVLLRKVIKSEKRNRRRKPTAQQFELLVGSSVPMQQVYTQIAKAAPTDATILICGESGTGKELVAKSIHNRSERSSKRFVAVNCGAIPDSLIESELFGCEKGAYTGADKTRKGVFEQAQNGTLFLDEITEMAIEAQIRLLRVLEERAVTRIGSDRTIKLNVRVIAATNRDPILAIEEGQFREDLHYRLAVFPMNLPKLSDRGEDVLLLANHFLTELNKSENHHKTLSTVGEQRILNYDWPGNVRQLRNMMVRSFILEEHTLDMSVLVQLINENSSETAPEAQQSKVASNSPVVSEPQPIPQPHLTEQDDVIILKVGTTLEEADRQLILTTLEQCDNNRTLAAQKLGISVKTLYNRLQKYEAM